MGEMEPDSGSFKWGVTTSQSYFPRDNSKYFENSDYNLVEWLRQFFHKMSLKASYVVS